MEINPIKLILNITESLRGRFLDSNCSYSVPDLVIDYLNHGEAKVALELLIDQLFELNIFVSKTEFESLLDLARLYKCDDRNSLAFIGIL